MNKNNNDKFFLRFIPIIFITLVLHRIVANFSYINDILIKLNDILLPCTWGFLIAYLLNPMLIFFEKKLKIRRSISLLIVYILFVVSLLGMVIIILPAIYESLLSLVKDIPTKEEFLDIISNINVYFSSNVDISNLLDNIPLNIDSFISKLPDIVKNYALNMLNTTYNITFSLLKFIIGIVISIYILSDKEKFAKRSNNLLNAVLGDKKSFKIVSFIKEIDEVFNAFIIGKLIDSIIIGIICLVGLLILKVKYATVISIFVGVTNMIPYFGPFIGAIPAVLLTLFYNPILALWVLIFIFLLQQFDGYILGPYILGDKVGISSFWIIFSILLFGGFFGIIGMLVGVPIVAILRNVINRNVDRILEERNFKDKDMIEDNISEDDGN